MSEPAAPAPTIGMADDTNRGSDSGSKAVRSREQRDGRLQLKAGVVDTETNAILVAVPLPPRSSSQYSV